MDPKTPRQYDAGQGEAREPVEKHVFKGRVALAFLFALALFSVLLAHLYSLQVIDHEEYVKQAGANRRSLIPTAPIRGEIIDANGIVLARNYSAFSLEIDPRRIETPFEDLLAILRQYVSISDDDVKRYEKMRHETFAYGAAPLKLKMNADEASRLSTQLFRLKGVAINARTFREYPYGELTSHVLGYIGRISQKDLERIRQNNQGVLYRGTTHIGKMGLEAYYEPQLHGFPGFEEVVKNSKGDIVRVVGSHPPKTGSTLKLSLDIRMQKEADRLLGKRRGAVVALNPETGGVLALVSKPSFDANAFIDGIDSDSWNRLNTDWQKPLLNRAIQGLYPPGSTFKPFVSMAALQSGFLGMGTVLPAPGAWSIPGSKHQFRDSVSSGHGYINLQTAIQVSSDTFFYQVAYKMGIDKLSGYVRPFGFGEKTGIDLPNEYIGVLPSAEWKERRFSKYKESARRWRPGDTVSIGIGQGYNAYTPLQMAFAAEILANEGKVYRPHLVQELIDHENKISTILEPKPSRTVDYNPAYYRYVKEGMRRVVGPGGTAKRIAEGLKYQMAGKTGTAQVVRIKQGARYNAAALAVQHRDHAWFISFAPVKKPKIVIAVLLENGGWGANAAPIARSLSDYWINVLKAGENKIEAPTDEFMQGGDGEGGFVSVSGGGDGAGPSPSAQGKGKGKGKDKDKAPASGSAGYRGTLSKITPEEIRAIEAQGIPTPRSSFNASLSTASPPKPGYKPPKTVGMFANAQTKRAESAILRLTQEESLLRQDGRPVKRFAGLASVDEGFLTANKLGDALLSTPVASAAKTPASVGAAAGALASGAGAPGEPGNALYAIGAETAPVRSIMVSDVDRLKDPIDRESADLQWGLGARGESKPQGAKQAQDGQNGAPIAQGQTFEPDPIAPAPKPKPKAKAKADDANGPGDSGKAPIEWGTGAPEAEGEAEP